MNTIHDLLKNKPRKKNGLIFWFDISQNTLLPGYNQCVQCRVSITRVPGYLMFFLMINYPGIWFEYPVVTFKQYLTNFSNFFLQNKIIFFRFLIKIQFNRRKLKFNLLPLFHCVKRVCQPSKACLFEVIMCSYTSISQTKGLPGYPGYPGSFEKK